MSLCDPQSAADAAFKAGTVSYAPAQPSLNREVLDQRFPIMSQPLYELRRLRPEMFALIEEMARVQVKKAGEYASVEDCYSNYVLAARDIGIEPWRYVQGRCSEKYARHVELTLKNKLNETDGGYRESAIDQASCWLIGCILFEREDSDHV